MYKLLRSLLFLFDPETIHNIISWIGEILGRYRVGRVLWFLCRRKNHALKQSLFGSVFPNPVGVAAGFDKNVHFVDVLHDLGFGFVEIGTVTPLPQIGNPRPRLFRLPADTAFINRMGFNNNGLDVISRHLKQIHHLGIVGGNIGKNKDTTNENALADYEKCFHALYDQVEYFVVNVSSPNTPGLRDLQDKKPLQEILSHIQTVNTIKGKRKPILLKIAPDLTNAQLDDVIEVVIATKIDGVIATNTTISREGLHTESHTVTEIGAGGLSGAPLQKRSTEVIRYLYQKTGGTLPIIGVGGIFTAEDAYEKIKAGASLVQVYTGLIYEGPFLACKINRGLLRLLQRDGYASVQEAIGAES